MPGLAGSGWDAKKYRFLTQFLLKSNDSDCTGWPGATRGAEGPPRYHCLWRQRQWHLGGTGDPQIPLSLAPKTMVSGGSQGTHRYHCLWRQRQWYLEGTFCKSYRILSLQRALLRRTLEEAGGRLLKRMDFGEKFKKSRFFGISVEQVWVKKTITIWTPFPDIVLFRSMKNLDFGGQISPTNRSLFSLNSPIRRPEKEGPRAKPAFDKPRF